MIPRVIRIYSECWNMQEVARQEWVTVYEIKKILDKYWLKTASRWQSRGWKHWTLDSSMKRSVELRAKLDKKRAMNKTKPDVELNTLEQRKINYTLWKKYSI